MVIFMTDFDRLCESIFPIDDSIRYVRVLGKHGVSLAGRYRDDKVPRYFTKNEIRELEKFYFFVYSIQEFHKPRVGNMRCVILELDKVRKFSFPLGDENLLIVTQNPESSIDIKDKIQENITTFLKTGSNNLAT